MSVSRWSFHLGAYICLYKARLRFNFRSFGNHSNLPYVTNFSILKIIEGVYFLFSVG